MTLRRHIRILTVQAAITLALVAVLFPYPVRSQGAGPADLVVHNLRAEIKTVDSGHADSGRLGKLWWQLGIAYQSKLDDAAAEDAYAHAIPLLRADGAEADYADALHGLGCVYMNTGRASEGRKYLVASLAMYEKLHDETNAAAVHQALGIRLLFDSKFKQAAAEFSTSIAEVTASPNGQAEPLVSSYLLLAAAEYRAGDAMQALAEVASVRAALAQLNLAPSSRQRIGTALVEGAALTRLGRAAEGQAAIQEAMRVAGTQSGVPQMISTRMQIGILREYSVALHAVHRKEEATRMEAQAAKWNLRCPARAQTAR